MKQTKQTPNAQRPTPNTEWKSGSEFDVRCSAFGVRCFLSEPQ